MALGWGRILLRVLLVGEEDACRCCLMRVPGRDAIRYSAARDALALGRQGVLWGWRQM
jgi:hypothetical protein